MKKILTFAYICIFLLSTIYLSRPAPITSDIINNAPLFNVLAVKDNEYRMLRLVEALESPSDYAFYLNESEITLDVGDIHTIRVINTEGSKQRITFFYSNSYMSKSTYDVHDNKITPVEYQLTSSIGHAFIYLIALLFSVTIAPFASRFTLWLFNILRNTKGHTL